MTFSHQLFRNAICLILGLLLSNGATLRADDCDGNGIDDLADIMMNPWLDCDNNQYIDQCTLNEDPSQDCNQNGRLDYCDVMDFYTYDCNGNWQIDDCEIANDPSLDCDNNLILDTCDITYNSSLDCDGNWILDQCESQDDCDQNGIPDRCEGYSDCDGNGQSDVCEIANDPSLDCDHDGSLDRCQPDSDGDSVYDGCDNCFLVPNPDQTDSDSNGFGDVCEPAPAGLTARVSVSSSEEQSNHDSRTGGLGTSGVSADGRYVVFESFANNLVPGDAIFRSHIYVRDRLLGTTVRASRSSSGQAGNNSSHRGCISADGRYVAFESYASNLDPSDGSGIIDVYVHDLQTGSTTRVSGTPSGTDGNGGSTSASISGDGRYVAFQSSSSNLVVGDTNGREDVFVHDRQTGTTVRASLSDTGGQAGNYCGTPSISSDGRYVAFSSMASNLISGGVTGQQIYYRDTQAGMTYLVSRSSGGVPGNGASYQPVFSGEGRYIVYSSEARNLLPGDATADRDIYRYDRVTGTTTLVSVSATGDKANGEAYSPSISQDGGRVVFDSYASNLDPNDSNGLRDIFLRDIVAGTTTLVSVDSAGSACWAESLMPMISGDGSTAAFWTAARNLIPDDTNGNEDIYVRSLPDPGGSGDAPGILAWRSVLTHGGAGEIGLVLSKSGVNYESRRDGIRKITIEFSEPVVAGDGTLSDEDVALSDSSSSYVPAGIQLANGGRLLEVLFDPEQLVEGTVYTLDIGSRFVGSVGGLAVSDSDQDCQIQWTTGDISNDGSVGLGDVGGVKSHNRAEVTPETAKYDVNGDGRINLIDAAMVRARMGG